MAQPQPYDAQDLKRRMHGAVEALKHDFGGLRTVRASSSLLEPIHVDAYGANMPLAQVGSISVPEPRMLQINVWDRGLVVAVEKAIRASNLGLNPQTEGQVIRLRMPDLTQERRKELVKVVRQIAEDGRVAVRNVRRDANTHLKDMLKKHDVPEDEEKRAQDEVQKLTDKAVQDIDRLVAEKEKELMAI